MDLENKEFLERLRILNDLPYSEFNRFYGDAVFQEGEGNIIVKMVKLLEQKQNTEKSKND